MIILLSILGYLAAGVAVLGAGLVWSPHVYFKRNDPWMMARGVPRGEWSRDPGAEGFDYLFTILFWPLALPWLVGSGIAQRTLVGLNAREDARRQLECDLAAARQEIDALLAGGDR